MKYRSRMKKMMRVTLSMMGIVAVAGGSMSAYADEASGNAVSGAGATVVVEQPNPLGVSSMTGAKKAASLKKVTLTWTQSGEAQGYVIMRKTGQGAFTEIARVSDGTPGSRTYEDTSVKPGTSYVYQVNLWRIRQDGTLEMGSCMNTVSVKLVPGKVKGLKAKKKRKTIVVTWKKTKNVTGYQVYTKVFVKGFKMKYSRAKTLKGRKYKRGMLVRGMKYGFRVRAYKKVGKKKVYGPFSTVTKRYK